MTRIHNDKFNPSENFNRGRPAWVFCLWYFIKIVFFLSAFPWPSALKSSILKAFGAKIGRKVYWKPRINIHFPWFLAVGDYTWIGEEVCIINFAPISIGKQCCISQRVFLCSGSHDYRSNTMAYRNEPIAIEDGVWISAQCFVGPGTRVGTEAVATANSTITQDLLPQQVCSGNPCRPIRPRWVKDQ